MARPDHLSDGVDAPQHREESLERECVGRKEATRVADEWRAEVLTQSIDDAVHRLVGHGLARVTASREHYGGCPPGQPIEERLDERALSDPGRPVDVNGHRRSIPDREERVIELRERRFAPKENRGAPPHRQPGSGARGWGAASDAEASQQVLSTGATLRVP